MIEVDVSKIGGRAKWVDGDTTNQNWTKAYVDRLMGSKQSPDTVSGDVSKSPKLLAALQKGRDTLTETSSEDDIRAAAKELAIRRSCKFGIEYALGLNTGAMIHYVLDGMDMLKVATKETFEKNISTVGGSISFRKVSICTSELRYLFRNWGRIAKTGRVKFYYNYVWIKPPWTEDFFKSTQQWAQYADHLATKHLGSVTGKPVNDLYKSGKYAETVEKYHELTDALTL